jgi:hypothetical protein
VVDADLRTSRRAVRHHALIVGDDRFDTHREGVQMYGEDCWGFRPERDPPTKPYDPQNSDQLWALRSAPLRFDWARGVVDRLGTSSNFTRCPKCFEGL